MNYFLVTSSLASPVHLNADVLRLSLCGLRGLVERGGLLLTLLVLPTAMVTNRNESELVRG